MRTHPLFIRIAGRVYRLADDVQTDDRISRLAFDIHSDLSALALFYKHQQQNVTHDNLLKASSFFNKLSMVPLKKPVAPPPVPKSAQAMTVEQAQETVRDLVQNIAELKKLVNQAEVVKYNSGFDAVLQMLQSIQLPQKTTASALPEYIQVRGRVFRRLR